MSSDAQIALKVKACVLLCALRGDFRYSSHLNGSLIVFSLTESCPQTRARRVQLEIDTSSRLLTLRQVAANDGTPIGNELLIVDVNQPFRSLLSDVKQHVRTCLTFVTTTDVNVAVQRPERNANITQLRNGRSSVERGFAAWALARDGNADGIQAIIEAFHSDRSRSVRIDALNALVNALKSQKVEQSVVLPLVKAACDDGDEVICKAAARIMKNMFADATG